MRRHSPDPLRRGSGLFLFKRRLEMLEFLWAISFLISNIDTARIYEMPEVVVTAERIREPLFSLPFSASVVDEEELVYDLSPNLFFYIERLPGLYALNYGGIGLLTTVSLRGGSSNGTTILFEGDRINLPQSGIFDLSLIPSSFVGRIETVRGGISSLYGEGPLNGVLALYAPSKSRTIARIEFGSYGLMRKGVSFRRKAIFFIAEDSKYNGDFTIPEGKQRKNNDFRMRSIFFKLGKKRNSFHILLTRKERGVPGPISFPTEESRQYDEFFKAGGSYSLGNLELRVSYLRLDNKYLPNEGAFPDVNSNESIRSSLIEKFHFLDSRFVVGVEGYRDYVESSNIGKRKRRGYLAFISSEKDIGKVSASLELSFEKSSLNKFQSSPRIALTYAPFSSLILRMSYSNSFRAPTLNDLYWQQTPFARGNPDLKPEYSNQREIGLRFSPNFYFFFDLCLWERNSRNLIEWIMGEDFVWTPKNLKKVKGRGIEGELKLRKFLGSYWHLSISYASLRDLTHSIPILYRPIFLLSLFHRTGVKELKCSAWLKVIGKRYYKTFSPEGGEKILSLPHSTLLYLDITYPIMKSLLIGFSVSNLFNENVEILKDYPIEGRALKFRLELTF